MAIQIKDITPTETSLPVGGAWFEAQRLSDNVSFKIRGYDIVKGSEGGIFYGDANGRVTQDVANLYYNADTERLGIGTNTVLSALHVSASDTNFFRIDDSVNVRLVLDQSVGRTRMQFGVSGAGDSNIIMSANGVVNGFDFLTNAGNLLVRADNNEYFSLRPSLAGGVTRFDRSILFQGTDLQMLTQGQKTIFKLGIDTGSFANVTFGGNVPIPNTENGVFAIAQSLANPTLGTSGVTKLFSKLISGENVFSVINSNNDEINFEAKGGWSTPTGTATRTGFDTTTPPSNTVLAEHLKAVIDDLKAIGLFK
jgi:hypothetical protein